MSAAYRLLVHLSREDGPCKVATLRRKPDGTIVQDSSTLTVFPSRAEGKKAAEEIALGHGWPVPLTWEVEQDNASGSSWIQERGF